MTIWRMCTACQIPKATTAHSGRVILIAFPQQQRLHERASLLHYTYIACIVHVQFCTQATVPRGLCSASHVYSSDS